MPATINCVSPALVQELFPTGIILSSSKVGTSLHFKLMYCVDMPALECVLSPESMQISFEYMGHTFHWNVNPLLLENAWPELYIDSQAIAEAWPAHPAQVFYCNL